MKTINDLNILYLARYAPDDKTHTPVRTVRSNMTYSQYHYDIWKILDSLYPNLHTAHEVSEIISNAHEYDYVFTLLNRAPYRNSEIFVSALLEYYNVPYLGARPNIRALAEDKHLAKMAALYAGIDTPEWIVVDRDASVLPCQPFPGPYFVKPRFGASSIGIDENSIADTWSQAQNQIRYLQKEGQDVILEKFVDGIFYCLPVYYKDNSLTFLPSVRQTSNYRGNLITNAQKRAMESGVQYSINPDAKLESRFQAIAASFIKLIQPIDYTRFDFIVENNVVQFIEFNVCCNLGIHSTFCYSADSVHISQEQLVTDILYSSLRRQGLIR